MEALDIAKEYNREVTAMFNDMTMLLYGSTVFGVNTSDLDVCFVRDKALSKEQFGELVELTRDFHKFYGLRIDEEVPYDNKLVYTTNFIEDALDNPPFPNINGKFIIPPISKEKEFLSSDQMSKRLLLNILTVKHIIMNDYGYYIEKYKDKAWEIILKVVISYSGIKDFNIEEIIQVLCKNPVNNVSGEMYLGYKTNLNEKIEFLVQSVKQQIEKLEKSDKLTRSLNKRYVPNNLWLS